MGLGALTACNSIDDVLGSGDNISISILETQDTVNVVPGDTTYFRFMVSTNNGSVKRIEVLANEEIFEGHPEKMSFGLIDTSMTLTADEQGYLSRDASSVIVNYPVYIKPNRAIVGNTTQVTFRATNKQGKTAENHVRFQGQNFRLKSTDLQLMKNANPDEQRFFDPYQYKAYSHKSFVSTDSVIPGSDETKARIALMFGYRQRLISMTPPPATYEMHRYIFSPDSEKAGSFMADTLHVQGYNPAEMKHTVFYHIDGVGGSYLTDSIKAEAVGSAARNQLCKKQETLDFAFFDENINEDYLNTLDFSQATDFLEIKDGGFYAFKTHDGLKGVFWINYPNNWDNPVPMKIRRLIFQAVATE